MNRLKNILALFCFIIITHHAKTQYCSVIFEGKDNVSFSAAINQLSISNYTNTIRFNDLNPEYKYVAKITLKDTTFKVPIQLLEENFIHIYQVNNKGVELKKMLPSYHYTNNKDMPIYSYLGEKEIAHEVDTLLSTLKDTLTTNDTIYRPPFETYYKLDDYTGKLGCPFPIKEEELTELKKIMSLENLEDSKIEKVKYAIQDMDSACVMVEQIKELIIILEFEETRLDFAKFMYKYTFDLDNYAKLNEVFNFENSREELEEYTKNQ